jgi:UDP-GlcNAc:undecaprenyl-phosphate GlcNAc-1-phosphate transferase
VKVIFVRHLFVFGFSFLLALYLLPLLIKTAFRFNILDEPDGKIKKHKKATPYLGGLAIYISFIAVLSIAYPFENQILWMLLGVTLLLFVGLIDDLKMLKPGQKFFGQLLAVFCFLKGGFSLKTIFFSDFLNVAISGFWMLLVINAFNLVDVMDGLSSVLAICSSIGFFVIALFLQQYEISLLLLAFLAPMVAFFLYNKPPAKIYLGDAGSMFVGGFMAAIPLLFRWGAISYYAYYTAVVVLGIPLLEVACLIIIRTALKIPFYRGSPHHFAIYLKHKGWGVLKVLIFSALMSFVLCVIAFCFLFDFIKIGALCGFGAIFLVIWCYFVFAST